jgi:DNA mismatch repair ATPase MutS
MPFFHIPTTPAGNAAGAHARKRLPTNQLLVDEQTFRDLEIFDAQDRGPSLFEWFNRTRTMGGQRVLEQRWRHPSNEIEKLRATQESVLHIARNPEAFKGIPPDGVATGVEHYIYSGMPIITNAGRIELFLQAIESRLDDERAFWKRVVGIQRLAEVVRGMRRMCDDPAQVDATGDIRLLLERARALLERPLFHQLPPADEEKPVFWKVMQLDRIIRQKERENIEALLQTMFEMDALISMAIAFNDRWLVMPTLLDGPSQIGGVDIYLPFIDAPIPNPMSVNQEKRLVFVTGPNMAGKTTYLRACGISIYLAHLGMGVPARSFHFTPCDSLFTAISLTDSVRAGVSFFQAEALRLKEIAEAIWHGRRVIGLLDEPFMGTNVKDALDGSLGVLTRLSAKENCLFIVSSHLIEVAEALDATSNVMCCKFEADESEGALKFDYTLRPGVSSQRLGMRVLREHGVFSMLDGRAGADATALSYAESQSPVNEQVEGGLLRGSR